MKDTPPAIERKFRQMLLKRSGAERLKMGCSMFATARALAKAALLQKHPDTGPAELKRLLFLHFYGADFEPAECNRIASALSKSRQLHEATHVRGGFQPAGAKRSKRIAESPASCRAKRAKAKRNKKEIDF